MTGEARGASINTSKHEDAASATRCLPPHPEASGTHPLDAIAEALRLALD